jgi:hypothetical protein
MIYRCVLSGIFVVSDEVTAVLSPGVFVVVGSGVPQDAIITSMMAVINSNLFIS